MTNRDSPDEFLLNIDDVISRVIKEEPLELFNFGNEDIDASEAALIAQSLCPPSDDHPFQPFKQELCESNEDPALTDYSCPLNIQREGVDDNEDNVEITSSQSTDRMNEDTSDSDFVPDEDTPNSSDFSISDEEVCRKPRKRKKNMQVTHIAKGKKKRIKSETSGNSTQEEHKRRNNKFPILNKNVTVNNMNFFPTPQQQNISVIQQHNFQKVKLGAKQIQRVLPKLSPANQKVLMNQLMYSQIAHGLKQTQPSPTNKPLEGLQQFVNTYQRKQPKLPNILPKSRSSTQQAMSKPLDSLKTNINSVSNKPKQLFPVESRKYSQTGSNSISKLEALSAAVGNRNTTIKNSTFPVSRVLNHALPKPHQSSKPLQNLHFITVHNTTVGVAPSVLSTSQVTVARPKASSTWVTPNIQLLTLPMQAAPRPTAQMISSNKITPSIQQIALPIKSTPGFTQQRSTTMGNSNMQTTLIRESQNQLNMSMTSSNNQSPQPWTFELLPCKAAQKSSLRTSSPSASLNTQTCKQNHSIGGQALKHVPPSIDSNKQNTIPVQRVGPKLNEGAIPSANQTLSSLTKAMLGQLPTTTTMSIPPSSRKSTLVKSTVVTTSSIQDSLAPLKDLLRFASNNSRILISSSTHSKKRSLNSSHGLSIPTHSKKSSQSSSQGLFLHAYGVVPYFASASSNVGNGNKTAISATRNIVTNTNLYTPVSTYTASASHRSVPHTRDQTNNTTAVTTSTLTKKIIQKPLKTQPNSRNLLSNTGIAILTKNQLSKLAAQNLQSVSLFASKPTRAANQSTQRISTNRPKDVVVIQTVSQNPKRPRNATVLMPQASTKVEPRPVESQVPPDVNKTVPQNTIQQEADRILAKRQKLGLSQDFSNQNHIQISLDQQSQPAWKIVSSKRDGTSPILIISPSSPANTQESKRSITLQSPIPNHKCKKQSSIPTGVNRPIPVVQRKQQPSTAVFTEGPATCPTSLSTAISDLSMKLSEISKLLTTKKRDDEVKDMDAMLSQIEGLVTALKKEKSTTVSTTINKMDESSKPNGTTSMVTVTNECPDTKKCKVSIEVTSSQTANNNQCLSLINSSNRPIMTTHISNFNSPTTSSATNGNNFKPSLVVNSDDNPVAAASNLSEASMKTSTEKPVISVCSSNLSPEKQPKKLKRLLPKPTEAAFVLVPATSAPCKTYKKKAKGKTTGGEDIEMTKSGIQDFLTQYTQRLLESHTAPENLITQAPKLVGRNITRPLQGSMIYIPTTIEKSAIEAVLTLDSCSRFNRVVKFDSATISSVSKSGLSPLTSTVDSVCNKTSQNADLILIGPALNVDKPLRLSPKNSSKRIGPLDTSCSKQSPSGSVEMQKHDLGSIGDNEIGLSSDSESIISADTELPSDVETISIDNSERTIDESSGIETISTDNNEKITVTNLLDDALLDLLTEVLGPHIEVASDNGFSMQQLKDLSSHPKLNPKVCVQRLESI